MRVSKRCFSGAWHGAMLISGMLLLSGCGSSDSGSPSGQAGAAPSSPASDPAPAAQAAGAATPGLGERIDSGRNLFGMHCAACHQAEGQGISGAFPPLAASDYLATDGIDMVIQTVVNGLSGPVTVNGVEYNSVMPPLPYLGDAEVADIATFVMNSWGNPGGEATPAQVAAARGGEAGSGP